MVLLKRASVMMAAASFIFVVASGTSIAAKTSGGKMYVPANIVKGSSVASGRSFKSSSLPEDTLAAIRLGRPAQEILARWGNPSRITVGSTTVQSGETPTAASPAAGVPSPYAGMAPSLDMAAGMLGMQGGPTMPGMMPGLPGFPGMPAPGGAAAPSAPQTGGTSSTLSEEEVTWTYDLPSGITLEFIITDGLITQITVGGKGPWGLSKTRTGLQLGDSYKLVLWVCGYPESQKYVGRFLRISYVNKNRALFTFLNNKLVGVTIAMVPSELTLQ